MYCLRLVQTINILLFRSRLEVCTDKAAEGINLLEGTNGHDHGDEEHQKAEDKVYDYDENSETINKLLYKKSAIIALP